MTIRLKSRRLADRSMSVGRQPGKPGWLATVVNLTGGTARLLLLLLLAFMMPITIVNIKR